MQSDEPYNSELLHLGDLAFPEDDSAEHHYLSDIAYIDQCLIAEEDRILLNQLGPGQVQEWCLSRITEYQNCNRVLRESYGAAASDAISTNKSHVRALRSAYNDAAPINRYLPPEMLMEIFSHVHPAVMPRPLVPVLRVCRYWRQLVLKTPQFWANLLSLPTWKAWNPEHDMGRFRAAVARSAPANLDLSVPYSNGRIVDILVPHASRLSSFKVGPTRSNVEEMTRVLEQHMSFLTHLAILHTWWYTKTSTFKLDFPRYPNIQILELERTNFYTPIAPYPSLCHLKLKRSTIRPSPGASGSLPTICAMHNALEFFPNLETLFMTHSLMDDDPRDRLRPPPALTKTVHLPRLLHLEIVDQSTYITRFLSHLAFPATTALVLEPEYMLYYSRRAATPVPLFPALNPFPASPTAELSLYLNFHGMPRDDRRLARWATHGAGVRPVHVALRGAAPHSAVVARFTRELAAAFAPAPACGVTSLAVVGTCATVSWVYWHDFMSDLPGLRRLAWARVSTAQFGSVVEALGEPWSDGIEDGFPCPSLEELALGWELPNRNGIRDSGQGERGSCSLQQQDGHRRDELESGSRIAAALSQFCDALVECLTKRAGHCEPIRRLRVSLHCDRDRHDCSVLELEGWQAALIEQHLRRALGHLVEDVAVSSEID